MHMKRFLLATLTLGTGFLVAEAAPPLTRLIPEDAAVVLDVQNVPELLAASQRSPAWMLMKDPSMQRFFAPALEQLDWEKATAQVKERTGYTPTELVDLIQGEAIAYIANFDFLLNPEFQAEVPVVIAIDFGANGAKVEALSLELAAKYRDQTKTEEESETYAGVVVHTSRPKVTSPAEEPPADTARIKKGAKKPAKPAPPISWAMAEGVLIASPAKRSVMGFIDALQKQSVDASFERSARYQRLKERAGPHQTLAMVHFPSIVPALQEKVSQENKGKSNPLGIDPSTVISALGVDAWNDLYVTGQIGETETVNYYGLTVSERRGLLKMFQLREGTFPRPNFLTARWNTVTTLRYSLQDLYEGLKETVRAISPAIEAMAQGYLTETGKKAGIDIERDLIGSLGDEFIQAQLMGGDGNADLQGVEQLHAISLSNVPAFTRAVEALKGLSGVPADKLFESREYLGHTIYSAVVPAGAAATAPRLSYAITDRYLLLGMGKPSAVESALQALAGQGDSFWEKPTVKAALTQVPDQASFFQSQDLGALFNTLLQTLAVTAERMAALPPPAGPAGSDQTPAPKRALVDPSAKPAPEEIARYLGENTSYGFSDAEGVHVVSRVQHPKP